MGCRLIGGGHSQGHFSVTLRLASPSKILSRNVIQSYKTHIHTHTYTRTMHRVSPFIRLSQAHNQHARAHARTHASYLFFYPTIRRLRRCPSNAFHNRRLHLRPGHRPSPQPTPPRPVRRRSPRHCDTFRQGGKIDRRTGLQLALDRA